MYNKLYFSNTIENDKALTFHYILLFLLTLQFIFHTFGNMNKINLPDLPDFHDNKN
jgi:hypothetical protein